MDMLTQTYLDVQHKSLRNDYRYRAKNETRLNRAYAKMLLEEGFLNKEDYARIDRGLQTSFEKVTPKDLEEAPNGVDLFFLYEQALYREIGMDTACKLHVGRSRNDIYFTEWRMSLREAVFALTEEILELQKLLERQAAENLETVIPYYTYGQPAQPGTWGHYLLSIHQAVENDLVRIRAAYKTINQCPMGAGAGIGSAFRLNKYRVAELLGFDGTIENTVMANSAVDYFLELEAAIAILSTTLERVGFDLDFFSSAECGILDGDSSICSGSSIMPQKKNYEMAARIRCGAYPYYGYLQTSLTSAGSASLFPAFETYLFFDEFWEKLEGVITTVRLLRLTLEHSKIRKDVALARARDGFTAATHMAEQLTMEIGEPFVKTHHIVGKMIHKLMDEDRLAVENMTPEGMKAASVEAVGFEVTRTEAEIAKMLDPLSSLNAKVTGGTPKPQDSERLLASGRAATEEAERWLRAAKAQVENAYASLDA